MNFYQFDDKFSDREFLSGRPVVCKAVLREEKNQDPPFKVGDFILVILSTGKKYKGKVTKFDFFLLNGYRIGELVIVRT